MMTKYIIVIPLNTYLAHVYTSWPLVTTLLMGESVLISANASHDSVSQRRMKPPRHAVSKPCSAIAMPLTQPLCALFSDYVFRMVIKNRSC